MFGFVYVVDIGSAMDFRARKSTWEWQRMVAHSRWPMLTRATWARLPLAQEKPDR
jgi:hypothetical protein